MLSDKQIRGLCEEQNMIAPYVPTKCRTLDNGLAVPSYGQTSFGYDVRLAKEFLVPNQGGLIDPMGSSEWTKITSPGKMYAIPPHSFVLAHTMEKFKIPDDVLGVAIGKSTYARCGIITPLTPLEPGWEGTLTLEIANVTDSHVSLYVGAGIVQIVFYQGERPENTYAGDAALYQGTVGAVPAGFPKISKNVSDRWDRIFNQRGSLN